MTIVCLGWLHAKFWIGETSASQFDSASHSPFAGPWYFVWFLPFPPQSQAMLWGWAPRSWFASCYLNVVGMPNDRLATMDSLLKGHPAEEGWRKSIRRRLVGGTSCTLISIMVFHHLAQILHAPRWTPNSRLWKSATMRLILDNGNLSPRNGFKGVRGCIWTKMRRKNV